MTILESEDIKKGETECGFFLGRMQPIHIGHAAIISKLKNPVVAIVKGADSSLDKSKNPLGFEYQKKLILKVAPGAKVIQITSAYLPAILFHLRKEGLEVKTIVAGPDRFPKYKSMIDTYNKKTEEDLRFDVEFVEGKTFQNTKEAGTSATSVRAAIRAGDEAEFKKLVPKQIWGEFDTLKTLISLNESLLSLLEDEASPNTTAEVAVKDVKLGKKPLKPKALEDADAAK